MSLVKNKLSTQYENIHLPRYGDSKIVKRGHSCAKLCPFEIPLLKSTKLRIFVYILSNLQKSSNLPHFRVEF